MATLLLSAAGAAIGANFGGAVLGLSGMVIGRAVGATVGRAIDQRLLGQGSGAVQTGTVQRLRVTGAGEGTALPRLWGRVRVPGQIIWASPFEEIPGQSRSSKGGFGPTVTEASRYVVSLAIALCEGEIGGITRVWMNADEVPFSNVNLRVYTGSQDQEPDPKIAAVEGLDSTPAYRGTAYVVIEDLDLAPFGNRVPNLAFEVVRSAAAPGVTTLQDAIEGVAWLPGSGEYALASEPITVKPQGDTLAARLNRKVVNQNTGSGESDLHTALRALEAELPKARSSLLIASWFGNDLRCSQCSIRPMVESQALDGETMPWMVAGLFRAEAEVLPSIGEGAAYGGTPADGAVIQAIQTLSEAGQRVVFYPFVLMDILGQNGKPDPWSQAADQPAFPWRGRITLGVAPGLMGSPDGTATAEAEVAAFFGFAQASDFSITAQGVSYTGPQDWSYRRFILHYAALCVAAGGVDAFCIGSELRGLTQIRGQNNSFPAVAALRDLAAEVRALLGPDVKLTYAADWSEYAGYDMGDGTRFFHLDPLWADANIDAVGIDNYMPLSDWRDGKTHRDREDGWRSIADLDYLKRNIAGGEGYDWYYADWPARLAQHRTPIADAAGEDWIWRVKDLRSWWSNLHVNQIAGQADLQATEWVPRSKPIWFVEYGCAAIDKGTNQPNVFLDPKSSESHAPYFSAGHRDDLVQMQYIRAMAEFWTDPANNPQSDLFAGRMVDWSHSHAWAWDARPWPWFPAQSSLWGDSENWIYGHWLTGRSSSQPLAAVVAEICQTAGVSCFDVSGLYGVVRGFSVDSTASGRSALQSLMLAFGFDAQERNECLTFKMRGLDDAFSVDPETLVAQDEGDRHRSRAPRDGSPKSIRLTFMEAESAHAPRSVEAILPDEASSGTAETELPLSLTQAEARNAVKRWLSEARAARDTIRFAVPASSPLGVGDVVRFGDDPAAQTFRLDRAEWTGHRTFEGTRVPLDLYAQHEVDTGGPTADPLVASGAVVPLILDLPLAAQDNAPHVLRIAATAMPWAEPAAVFDALSAGGTFTFRGRLDHRATIGQTVTPLFAARPGLIQRSTVDIAFGATSGLGSRTLENVLEGQNLLAMGDGANWEVLQFTTAELIGVNHWRLGGFLRGRFGTAPLIPPSWPEGTWAVVLDSAVQRFELEPGDRGRPRLWRIGPASLPWEGPAFTQIEATPRFAGLRPYAPVHLRCIDDEGTHRLTWIRQTRLGGDAWDVIDVPLAEDSETYRIQIASEGVLRREVIVSEPSFTYPEAVRAADGVSGDYVASVAQLSSGYGAGLSASLIVAE